ncbi:hypothetical protein TCAL_15384 [Tigriopus californicus]|uniref:Uncharacterized protein n=1 Tax=Tigriopus californicus TaxID=6832 RepID=A0A553PJI4_TIGCA|nr:uncharacterized protein LOC131890126 [Tigriopus californicus]TRY77819.1 hypothetical protein TCAL_15384 [Tigriopus californicus]
MSSPLLKRVQWERNRRQIQRLRRSTFLLTLVQILLAFYHLALALGSQSSPSESKRNINSKHNNSASFHHLTSNASGLIPSITNDFPPSAGSNSSRVTTSANTFFSIGHRYNATGTKSIKNEPRCQDRSKENMVWMSLKSVPISVSIGGWFFVCQLLPLILALFSLFNLSQRCHLLIPVLFLQPINLMVFILVSVLSYQVAFQDSQREEEEEEEERGGGGEGGAGRMWLTVGALIIFITTLNLLSWWSYLKLYLNVSSLWPNISAPQPLIHISGLQCHAIRHSPSSGNRSSSTGEDGSNVILMPHQPSPPPTKYQLHRQRTNATTAAPPIKDNHKDMKRTTMSHSDIHLAN